MRPWSIGPLLCTAACATANPKEPARGHDGLPVTRQTRFDAHFQEAQRLETHAEELEAKVRALTGPVAAALELPPSAPIDDLALALRKARKREARGDPPSPGPRPRAVLDTAARAATDAATIRSGLHDTIARSERLLSESEALARDSPKTFAQCGSAYVAAVGREIVDTRRRLGDAVARLRAADAFADNFATQLAAAGTAGN